MDYVVLYDFTEPSTVDFNPTVIEKNIINCSQMDIENIRIKPILQQNYLYKT